MSYVDVGEQIRAERAAKDAHWAANPLPHPTYSGRPLQVGDRVRLTEGHYYEGGVVTEITVRCYGRPEDEKIIGPGFVEIGRRPMQQIWIALNGMNVVYHPEDIAEVLDG